MMSFLVFSFFSFKTQTSFFWLFMYVCQCVYTHDFIAIKHVIENLGVFMNGRGNKTKQNKEKKMISEKNTENTAVAD